MFSDILYCDIDKMNSLNKKIKIMKVTNNQSEIHPLLRELWVLKKDIELRARFLIERDFCKQKIDKFKDTIALRNEAVENYQRNMGSPEKNNFKNEVDKYQNYLDILILEVATENKLVYIKNSINNYGF